MTPTVEALIDEAERQPFTGWDFSWIERRITADPLPWDYTAAVVKAARDSPDLLDLGTGGGEWLAALPFRPPRTVATEAWLPNVAIAKARLEPLGIEVIQVPPARDNTGKPIEGESSSLPFADGSFHLAVDRHEAFDVASVARILAPGGQLITQQVDVGNDNEYRALFGIATRAPKEEERWEAWLPGQLERVGLRVVEQASAPFVQHVRDVGALVYGLKAIPWMVPGFTVDKYRRRLHELQSRIDRDGPITVRQRRYFVRAQKPASNGKGGAQSNRERLHR
jgi:SAM-dependent methyltransferase